MSLSTACKILIIDDHPLFRRGLSLFLKDNKDYKIIEAENGQEGLQKTKYHQPDLILLDLHMPSEGGLSVLQKIMFHDPLQRVLILTVSEDIEDLSTCLSFGIKGYLLKNIDTHFLSNAIKKVMQDKYVFSPEISLKLKTELDACPSYPNSASFDLTKSTTHATPPNNHLFETLTEREKLILHHITMGQSNKKIAYLLEISINTVKVHVQHIYQKLEVSSRTQAALLGLHWQSNRHSS